MGLRRISSSCPSPFSRIFSNLIFSISISSPGSIRKGVIPKWTISISLKVISLIWAAALSCPKRKILARSHHKIHFSTSIFSTSKEPESLPLKAKQSSSVLMKQLRIRIFRELTGFRPSSFRNRLPTTFIFSTVIFSDLLITEDQVAPPCNITSFTNTLLLLLISIK